ncbi:MAG TPA: S1C family serine protease [Caulobacteraceae bacterium]
MRHIASGGASDLDPDSAPREVSKIEILGAGPLTARKLVTLAVSVVALGGIARAGNVERFYHSNPKVPEILPAPPTPTLLAGSGDVTQDMVEGVEEGRVVIGYSSFNGPPSSDREVVSFAKKIGAAYVIRETKYRNTVEGPSFGSSTFGRFGAFSFFVPSTIDRFDQVDLYLADTPRRGIGLYGRPLKAAEAAALGTNQGLVIMGVRRGSPAFTADVLPEDVVTSMNGVAVYDVETMKAAVIANYGATVTLKILRGGKAVVKQVPLPRDGAW